MVRPVSFAFLSAGGACMALAVVLLFMFGSYTRRTTVEGIVVPNTGVIKVYVPQRGTVLRKTVTEGQHVTRGAVLYMISTDLQSATEGPTQAALIGAARLRKQSLLDEIGKTRALQKDERDTMQAKLAHERAELAHLDNQLVGQRERVSIAADAVARYKRLLAQDYISMDQLQHRQNDLLDQQSKLQGLLGDRLSLSQNIEETARALAGLPLKQQIQVAQINRSVIDVDQTLIESEARREYIVAAPENGFATAVMAEPGQTVDTDRPVVSIIPDDAHWQVQLFVPNGAISFVHVGDPVNIRYQAYPYQKFGQCHAHVTSVGRVALSVTELANGGSPAVQLDSGITYYRVTVALDAQTDAVHGTREPLQAGMTLQADILQQRRRLYQWALEPLYSVTDKL